MINFQHEVCVIGAGPGGLAMARLLQLRGASVTVLEKRERAGGMTRSVEYKGQWFDVGANYVTSDYREVRALAKDLKLKMVTDKAFQNQLALNTETGKLVDAQKVVNSGHSKFELVAASLRYFWYQFKYRKMVAAPGYAEVADDPDLMSYFEKWLLEHKMAPLQKLLMIPITAMGFGTLDKIPTPHALRYVNASRFWSMLKTGLNIPQCWPKRFEKGFGNLWQDVAGQLYVEYSCETVEVDRSGERIAVVTEKDGCRQTRHFDRLVLALLPSEALNFLDSTAEEKALYSKDVVLRNHYVVATASVSNFKPWVVNTMRSVAGDSGSWPKADGNPYIFGKQWRDSELNLYYAPIEEAVDRDQVREQMQKISAMASENDPETRFGEWQDYANWPHYFPRVSLENMQSFNNGPGWYDQVEALQGSNRTFLCHGVMSFELVELVMRYARHLVTEKYR